MPKQYEAIKRSVKAKNPKMSSDKVKEHAAKIYNSLGKGHVGKGSK